jgi:hypothetical protein
MDYGDLLRETSAKLQQQLAHLETEAEKLRHVIEGIGALLPTEQSGEGPQSENAQPTHRLLAARPRLRDAVQTVLRENPDGMTLPDLAQNLWERGWVGGENKPSLETVRGALLALRRDRLTESDRLPNSKSHKWRLAKPRAGLLDVISQSLQQARNIQGLPTLPGVAPSSEVDDPSGPERYFSEGR